MKQNRASASAANEDEELKSAPHSFVVHKGNVGKHVQVISNAQFCDYKAAKDC